MNTPEAPKRRLVRRNATGQLVRLLRKERGITLKQLADAVNVSPSHIHDIETGKRGTTAEKAELFAVFFGQSRCSWVRMAIEDRIGISLDRMGLSLSIQETGTHALQQK